MTISVILKDQPDEQARELILDALIAANERGSGPSGYRPLTALIYDDDDSTDTVLGGLYGRTAYGWLFVELLFVPEPLRGQGIGASLMRRAEREALARGCHSAWLDTFSFQAPDFYRRLGYTVFGRLDGYPAPHSRFFMQKTLAPSPDDKR